MSSGLRVRGLVVQPNAVRDWRRSFVGIDEDTTIDLWQEYKVAGLDWWIHNRGANPLTVEIDSQPGIPVAVGAAHGENNIKYSLVHVDVGVGAEVFDLVVAGVLFV